MGVRISAAVINGRNYVRSLESAEGYVSLLYFTCINGAFAMFNLYSDAIPMAPEEEETLVSLLETATLE